MPEFTTRAGNSDRIALDFKSARSYDEFGRLHVAVSNLSKANVCPYYGAEIPGYAALGLHPRAIYHLYRDAAELEKAAASCNGIQLMSEHIAVDAEQPQLLVTAGAVGTNAVFAAPYLQNSLTVWDKDDIKNIEDGRIRELSCGYSYEPDMTPGTVDGVRFDGVMRNIVFNHVALVRQGRAGADCVVADSQINLITELDMSKSKTAKLSRAAAMVKGALTASLKTVLAKDQSIDTGVLVANVTRANWQQERPILINGLRVATRGKLARDADLRQVLDMLDSVKNADLPEDDEMDASDDGGDGDDDMGDDAGNANANHSGNNGCAPDADALLETIIAAVRACFAPRADASAQDEPVQTPGAANADPKNGKNKALITAASKGKGKDADADKDKASTLSQSALDQALAENARAVEKATVARIRAIARAEQQVSPYVGKLALTMDSAEAVYRAALKLMQANDRYPGLQALKIDDVHPAALEAILISQPRPGGERGRLAQDAAANASSAGKLITGIFGSH